MLKYILFFCIKLYSFLGISLSHNNLWGTLWAFFSNSNERTSISSNIERHSSSEQERYKDMGAGGGGGGKCQLTSITE